MKKSPAIVPLANMKIYNDNKLYALQIKTPIVHRISLSNYSSRIHNIKMNNMNKILTF